jgi:hypothetical protein
MRFPDKDELFGQKRPLSGLSACTSLGGVSGSSGVIPILRNYEVSGQTRKLLQCINYWTAQPKYEVERTAAPQAQPCVQHWGVMRRRTRDRWTAEEIIAEVIRWADRQGFVCKA